MTREEVIAELHVLYERLSNPKDCEDGCYDWEDGWYVEAIDMAIKALEQTRWIPCSERLPISPKFCLVTTDGSNGDVVDIALYMSDGWHKASEVLAWKPLPEPYRKENQ